MSRWYDKRRHLCGCITVFDMRRWKSVALNRCEAHAPHDPDYNEAWRP